MIYDGRPFGSACDDSPKSCAKAISARSSSGLMSECSAMSMVLPHFSQRISSRTRSHPIHKRAFFSVMLHKVVSVGRFDTLGCKYFRLAFVHSHQCAENFELGCGLANIERLKKGKKGSETRGKSYDAFQTSDVDDSPGSDRGTRGDRKSTRLNSSHTVISY